MKHMTSRLLFAYWDRLRGERAAPERADIVPGAIRHILADTFILGREAGADTSFRLAGTRCCALLGRSLKDQPLASLWPDTMQGDVARQMDVVMSETAGLVAGLTGTAENGWTVELELLLLPLRHRGSAGTRALGALSPLQLPSWAGLVPIVSVETNTLRVVSATRERRYMQSPQEGPAARRERFVVLDGGLR
jgi:hypothetical protein